LRELRGVKRWLLVAAVVVLTLALCYGIYLLSPYFEGFEQYGYVGAFLAAFVSNTSIVFPVPGIAVVIAIAANPAFNWVLVAIVAGIGAALGEITAYLVGASGRAVIVREQTERYLRAEGWMRRWGGITIFIFSLAPFLPFDVAGVAAGALRYPLWRFVLFCLAGRIPKYMIECAIGVGLVRLLFPFLFFQ